MFTEALCTIAKKWKKSKVDKHDIVYPYNRIFGNEKNEGLIWMNLENSVVCERSQKQKAMYYMIASI